MPKILEDLDVKPEPRVEAKYERHECYNEVQWYRISPRAFIILSVVGVGWRPEIPEICSCFHLVDPFWHADRASFGTVWPDAYGIDCTYLRHTFLIVPKIVLIGFRIF